MSDYRRRQRGNWDLSPRNLTGNESPNRIFTLITADKMLDWAKSSRATFWCWMLIKSATCQQIGISVPDLQDDKILLDKFIPNHNATIHQQRFDLIKQFFIELEQKSDQTIAMHVMNRMKEDWLIVKDKLREITWLPKTEPATQWAWNYIRKQSDFKNGIAFWFQPIDARERHMAIIAAFDENSPGDYSNMQEAIDYRSYLLNKFKNAYDKDIGRAKDPNKTQLSVVISKTAKSRLSDITKKEGITQQQVIENMIMNY